MWTVGGPCCGALVPTVNSGKVHHLLQRRPIAVGRVHVDGRDIESEVIPAFGDHPLQVAVVPAVEVDRVTFSTAVSIEHHLDPRVAANQARRADREKGGKLSLEFAPGRGLDDDTGTSAQDGLPSLVEELHRGGTEPSRLLDPIGANRIREGFLDGVLRDQGQTNLGGEPFGEGRLASPGRAGDENQGRALGARTDFGLLARAIMSPLGYGGLA